MPSGEFPFRYARSFAELERRIGELVPRLHGDLSIAYQPRLPPQEQEERRIDSERFLVLVGRTGLGKTRESVEAIRRLEAHTREPVTILLPIPCEDTLVRGPVPYPAGRPNSLYSGISLAVELAACLQAGPPWWRRTRVKAALRALGPWTEIKAATLECPEAYLPQSVSFAQDGRATLVSRTLQNLRSSFSERLAPKVGNLGNFLTRYPLGSRVENLEVAIGCFRTALEVRTREAFPREHALVTRNLESTLVVLEDLTSGESA